LSSVQSSPIDKPIFICQNFCRSSDSSAIAENAIFALIISSKSFSGGYTRSATLGKTKERR
jgi:Na+/glutamate symporter